MERHKQSKESIYDGEKKDGLLTYFVVTNEPTTSTLLFNFTPLPLNKLRPYSSSIITHIIHASFRAEIFHLV